MVTMTTITHPSTKRRITFQMLVVGLCSWTSLDTQRNAAQQQKVYLRLVVTMRWVNFYEARWEHLVGLQPALQYCKLPS